MMNKDTVFELLLTEMPAVPYDAAGFVADGVTKFYLLDFDGVLNAFLNRGTLPKSHYDPKCRAKVRNPDYDPDNVPARTVDREPKSFDIMWSNDLVDDLNKLFADNSAQVVFLTTWRGYMSTMVDLLGLKSARPFYYLPWGTDTHRFDHHLKIAAAMDFFGKPFPSDDVKVHWGDDVLFLNSGFDADDVLFANLKFDNLHTVAPNPRAGYSRKDIADVAAFMNGDING